MKLPNEKEIQELLYAISGIAKDAVTDPSKREKAYQDIRMTLDYLEGKSAANNV